MTQEILSKQPGRSTRPRSKALLLAVMFEVGFGRLRSMMGDMQMVGMREVGMVRSFLVSAGFMVLGRFLVMTRGVLVMFGGFLVMVCCLF
jgi:hypothetical protein